MGWYLVRNVRICSFIHESPHTTALPEQLHLHGRVHPSGRPGLGTKVLRRRHLAIVDAGFDGAGLITVVTIAASATWLVCTPSMPLGTRCSLKTLIKGNPRGNPTNTSYCLYNFFEQVRSRLGRRTSLLLAASFDISPPPAKSGGHRSNFGNIVSKLQRTIPYLGNNRSLRPHVLAALHTRFVRTETFRPATARASVLTLLCPSNVRPLDVLL